MDGTRDILFGPLDRPQHLLSLARVLTPHLGGLPHDLATELRYGGGWLARGVSEELAESVEQVCADNEVTVCVTPALPEVLTHAVKRAAITEEGFHLTISHWERTLTVPEIGLASLWVLGRVGPSEELRSDEKVKKPVRVDTFQQHIAALPKPDEDLREALEGVELGNPRPLFFIVQRDPIEVFQLVGEETMFPDLGPLGFIGALLDVLPPQCVLAETQASREAVDFSKILVHRPEEIARRASWLAALVTHGLG